MAANAIARFPLLLTGASAGSICHVVGDCRIRLPPLRPAAAGWLATSGDGAVAAACCCCMLLLSSCSFAIQEAKLALIRLYSRFTFELEPGQVSTWDFGGCKVYNLSIRLYSRFTFELEPGQMGTGGFGWFRVQGLMVRLFTCSTF